MVVVNGMAVLRSYTPNDLLILPMQYGNSYRNTISCGFSRLSGFSDLHLKVKEGQELYGLIAGISVVLLAIDYAS